MEEGNANENRRKRIKELHYDSVMQYLQPPGPQRIDDLFLDNLSPTGLTYMCVEQGLGNCYEDVQAAVYQTGDGPATGHMMSLCSSIFEVFSYEKMLQDWRDTATLSFSAGFTLLHEAQHLSTIVSDSERCIDVENPEAREEEEGEEEGEEEENGCYDEDW